MITLNSIKKNYNTDFWRPPHLALDNVSFTIQPGKITGFLGENGAGKTTAIKIILGLSRPDNGHIQYGNLGKNITEALKNIGYMPERPYYYPNSTGKEFLTYLASLHNISKSNLNTSIKRWSEKLLINHAIDWKIKSYSKGMLQRLGVISALVHSPEFILLDEPVSGMDPIGRKEIKDVLVEINKKEGRTVFFSTHILPDVEEICSEIILIQKGKLSYSGTLSELISTNSSEFIINYELNATDHSLRVSAPEKDQALLSLVLKGAHINSLSTVSPKLENIIYKV